MGTFWDILLAGACVCGLAFVGWWLFGLLLRPLPGREAKVVIPGRGEGEELEQALSGLLWLRGAGFVQGQVILADVDLTAQGQALARILAEREPGVYLCSREALPQCLEALLEREPEDR